MAKRRTSRVIQFRNYREPTVTQGPDAPIPETRQDVLFRIIEQLDAKGPFRKDFSNGEFTSSSLALAYSFADCLKIQVLECPGYTIHKDPVLGIFWRRGGCWD